MSVSEKSCNSEVTLEENQEERRRRTLSDICIAFEDEKNREMNVNVEKKSECGSYDFDSKSFDGKSAPIKNFKMYICKSVENSKECPYGKKCKFAHNEEELVTKSCTHGTDCDRIEIKNGKVINKSKKNMCIFIHPRESISSFLSRKGLKGFPGGEDKPNDTYKFTRMCVSYTQNIKCLKGEECTYAHDINELKTTPCNFASKCNNVRRNGKHYVNHGQKLCIFLHPDESLDNYYNRALSGKKPEKYLKHKTEKYVEEDEDDEDGEDEDEEVEDDDDEAEDDDEKIVKKDKITEITLKIYEKDVAELLTIVLAKIKIHNFSTKS